MNSIMRSLITTLVMGIVLCLIYPLLMVGIGSVCFPFQSTGSLMVENNRVVGSMLIGQNFFSPAYFHSRPSSAGKNGYDASNSSASNYGPTSQTLIDGIKKNVALYRAENHLLVKTPVPLDAVCASGSGLDPHISLENAKLQAQRIASLRGVSKDKVLSLVAEVAEKPTLGFIGTNRVNVLKLNLLLDQKTPLPGKAKSSKKKKN